MFLTLFTFFLQNNFISILVHLTFSLVVVVGKLVISCWYLAMNIHQHNSLQASGYDFAEVLFEFFNCMQIMCYAYNNRKTVFGYC